jgi:cyclin B
MISFKKKFLIPNSTREFGKEINVSSNLTTLPNQNVFNPRKSFCVPIEQKIKNLKKEKEELNNKLKNYKQIVEIRKKKKEMSNSFPHKPASSNGKINMNQSSREQFKKGINKIKIKNQSQKNILGDNNKNNMTLNMTITDDIVMVDENTNPNIVINNDNTVYENKIKNKKKENEVIQDNGKVNDNINVNNIKKEEDVLMQIETEVKDMKLEDNKINEIIPKNVNPQNVDEYFDDICDELSKNEDKYLVDPEYMSYQTDINHRMRAILIDWLIDVHLKYRLLPQTMYIAVNLIDRYLEKAETNRAKLQLVGVTAMFIACKYEEIYPPELKDFVYITDGAYVKSDVLKMESKMLAKLNFDVTFPTQWTLFETYKRKLDLDEKTFKLAWFLMELCLIDYKILKFKMSEIAASAILIAAKNNRVYKQNWLKDIIGIDENSLEECCEEIYDFYAYNATHNLQAIRRKFSSSKFGEVAKIKLC